MMGDRRLKILVIATKVGVSYSSILNMLHEHLGLSKVRARWAPCFLTPVLKSLRMDTCSELLDICSATMDNVLSRIITAPDETWIRHWDPDTKHESLQWKHVISPPLVKFRTQRRLEKLWPQFSQITKACFWWNYTYNRRQQCMMDPTTVKC